MNLKSIFMGTLCRVLTVQSFLFICSAGGWCGLCLLFVRKLTHACKVQMEAGGALCVWRRHVKYGCHNSGENSEGKGRKLLLVASGGNRWLCRCVLPVV